MNIHWKDRCWSWSSNTLVTWCEELTHLKRPWCWERLKVKGGRDDRGWDGWMASLKRWTWVWVHSGSWWWTGRPGVLRFMRLQRVRHDWATDLNWKEINPEYSLEGQMLKLKLQYSSHLMWKADSLEKTLMLGKIEGRRRERQNEVIRWHHQHNWHELWSCSNLSKVQEIVKNKEAWHAAIHGITKLDTTVTEQHHQPIPLLSENQSL